MSEPVHSQTTITRIIGARIYDPISDTEIKLEASDVIEPGKTYTVSWDERGVVTITPDEEPAS